MPPHWRLVHDQRRGIVGYLAADYPCVTGDGYMRLPSRTPCHAGERPSAPADAPPPWHALERIQLKRPLQSPWPQNELIAEFGQIRLVRTLEGETELRSGATEDRQNARD